MIEMAMPHPSMIKWLIPATTGHPAGGDAQPIPGQDDGGDHQVGHAHDIEDQIDIAAAVGKTEHNVRESAAHEPVGQEQERPTMKTRVR